jgi:hypothetical protein
MENTKVKKNAMELLKATQNQDFDIITFRHMEEVGMSILGFFNEKQLKEAGVNVENIGMLNLTWSTLVQLYNVSSKEDKLTMDTPFFTIGLPKIIAFMTKGFFGIASKKL